MTRRQVLATFVICTPEGRRLKRELTMLKGNFEVLSVNSSIKSEIPSPHGPCLLNDIPRLFHTGDA